MPKILLRLRKKDRLRERSAENMEEHVKPREWTQAELGRPDRILLTPWGLQAVLPATKDVDMEAARHWKMIQEVAQVDGRLIDTISQDNLDVMKFGNPEAILRILIGLLETLTKSWNHSYIQGAYQTLKQEQMMNW
jgi:hypothetical protein